MLDAEANGQNIPEVESDDETDDEAEETELNENEFNDADEQLTSVEDQSIIDQYLQKIQDDLRGKGKPEAYKNGTFWIYPQSPSFALDCVNIDPTPLYQPRVFLWFPHHLKDVLIYPHCKKAKLKVKGFPTDPRGRRIIDLFE